MKQLKFMLAAATAIGLATAAQAGTQQNPLVTDNFDTQVLNGEEVAIADKTPATDLSGYTFTPAEDESETDNESIVKAGAGEDSSNALSVNTGKTPLLRVLDSTSSAGVNLTEVNSLCIDTMVQFTVTPIGDPVAIDDENKLMIYLQQTNEVNVVGGEEITNTVNKLMVCAGMVVVDEITQDILRFDPDRFVVTAEGLTVNPNTWYNLKVNAVNTNGLAAFTIFIGDYQLKSGVGMGVPGDVDGFMFPSMQGIYHETTNPNAITLTHVGFAGEGMVDDLNVFTITEQTSVDFTFALELGDGVSAVQWTIGGVEQTGNSGTVKKDQVIKIVKVTYKDWYGPTGDYVDGWEVAYSEALGAGITIGAKPTANVTTDEQGNVKIEVTENTKPADVGVKKGSFADANTAPAELNKALTWATAKGGATSASAAGALVSELDFAAGEEETDAEKAYLLDCTEDELSGEDGEIAKFKFAGFDPATGTFKVGTEKQVGDKAAYGNGYVEVRGSATVGGAYDEVADKSKHSFFKAFLVPFLPAAAEVE